MNQVWPAMIAAAAMIVFIIFLVPAGAPVALVMALTALLACGFLVTVVTGTVWLTGLGRLAIQRHR